MEKLKKQKINFESDVDSFEKIFAKCMKKKKESYEFDLNFI